MGYDTVALAKALDRALESDTLREVTEYGYCSFQEAYNNECGQRISINLYEYHGKMYVVRYVDGECVAFYDVTPKGDK